MDINPDRLAAVVQRFLKLQASGAFPGGQLVLRRLGTLVLKLSAGIARGFRSDYLQRQFERSPRVFGAVLRSAGPVPPPPALSW